MLHSPSSFEVSKPSLAGRSRCVQEHSSTPGALRSHSNSFISCCLLSQRTDATALHAAVDMLDPEPATVQGLVGPLLLPCQLLSSWLLGRHEDGHVGKRKGQEAQILQQSAP